MSKRVWGVRVGVRFRKRSVDYVEKGNKEDKKKEVF